MAAVAVVFLLRPPRARPVPARVVPGDVVSTDDGLRGTIVRLDGSFALVDAGDRRLVWARCADLMYDDAASGIPAAQPGGMHGAIPGDVYFGIPGAPAPSPAALPDTGGGLVRFAEG